MKFLTFNKFLIERSGDLFKPKRGKPVIFNPRKNKEAEAELSTEFFELIRTAYAAIGGHAKIQSPEDVFSDPDWNWWEGVDLHGSRDFDLIMFGQKTKYGVKFSGVGHDGSSEAKREYIKARGKDLQKPGYYVEVSGRIAEILIKDYRCPIVEDPEEVMKVLGKPVKWEGKNPEDPKAEGEGWYTRMIGGHPHAKILLGRPKV